MSRSHHIPSARPPRNSHPVLALPSYLIGWIDLTSPVDVNHDWNIPRYWYTNCNHSLSNLYHYIENSLRDGQSGSIAGLTFEPQMIAEDFGVPKKTKIIQPLVSPVLVDVPYRKKNTVDQIMSNHLQQTLPKIWPFLFLWSFPSRWTHHLWQNIRRRHYPCLRFSGCGEKLWWTFMRRVRKLRWVQTHTSKEESWYLETLPWSFWVKHVY